MVDKVTFATDPGQWVRWGLNQGLARAKPSMPLLYTTCPWQRFFFWLLRFADGADPFKLRQDASLAQLPEHTLRERACVGLIPTRGFPREAPSHLSSLSLGGFEGPNGHAGD